MPKLNGYEVCCRIRQWLLCKAQTIAEEEVAQAAHISGPLRVRWFLSRFMVVVVVVAICIKASFATFSASHDEPLHLACAASVLLAAGVQLAAWGVFIRLNVHAEILEPEATAKVKNDDKKPSNRSPDGGQIFLRGRPSRLIGDGRV